MTDLQATYYLLDSLGWFCHATNSLPRWKWGVAWFGQTKERKKKIMQEISLKKMNGKIMSMKIRVKDFIKPTEIILLFLRLYTLT